MMIDVSSLSCMMSTLMTFEKMQLSNILLILVVELSCLSYCFPTQNEKMKDALDITLHEYLPESDKNDTIKGSDYYFHKANYFTGEESAEETTHIGENQDHVAPEIEDAKTSSPEEDEDETTAKRVSYRVVQRQLCSCLSEKQ